MAPFTDPTSQSNLSSARVVDSAFELAVSFENKTIEGYVTLTVRAEVDDPETLVLDTKDLIIHSVALVNGDGAPQAATHRTGDAHPVLGVPLSVDLPKPLPLGQEVKLGIHWTTSPGASALQFLEPQQTAGGQHPYLFTQCQAIHARTFVPCQDSPGAKMTYSAAVRVPQPLVALMSAVPVEQPTSAADEEGLPHLPPPPDGVSTSVFWFSQRVPIPPYLLALAVGELAGREISARSRVWAEPSVVDACLQEFADTGKYLEAAEEIAGEYVWGRYDLLVLPPSFPYGGMENPCLTFVTPTLLAGDRSLTGVIAHEIAHSWTGNLVTNASWEHFWLNEGWTVFLERKILGRVFGEALLQFNAAGGLLALTEDVARIGPQHNYTALVPDLSGGGDPDDSFSRVPYEKGFYFLYHLQDLVGGAEVFEPFLRAYIHAFRFSTVTSDQFREFFSQYFAQNTAAQALDWDTWLHAPGMPPAVNNYNTSLATAPSQLATAWHTMDVMGIGVPDPAPIPPASPTCDPSSFTPDQWVSFLQRLAQLRALTPLHVSTTRALAAAYGLEAQRNAEIRAAWYRLCADAGDDAALPDIVQFLKSQGRMKYVRPLYRSLSRSRSEAARRCALDTFAAARDSYHPIAQKMLDADLKAGA